MRKISFIGSYDKIDLILYIAKILVATDKKSFSNRFYHKSKGQNI